MKLLHKLDYGYGKSFAFDDNSDYWASAEAGILHVWKGFILKSSYLVPGYSKGNIVFNDTTISVSLFTINYKKEESRFKNTISESLANDLDDGYHAHHSQYKIDEAFHIPGSPLLITAISHQPSRSTGGEVEFYGPSNRLLLFDSDTERLLAVIHQNNDTIAYSHIVGTMKFIIYTERDFCHTTVGLLENTSQVINHQIKNFVPFGFSSSLMLSGCINSRYIQFRQPENLALLNQLPQAFQSVDHVFHGAGYDFLSVVNKNTLLFWCGNEHELMMTDKISTEGIIEGVGFNKKGVLFVAVAEKQKLIYIYDTNTSK